MISKNKLLIIGAKGHGKVVADIAIKMNEWQEIAFLDDDDDINISMGIKVIGRSKNLEQYVDEFDIFVAIGDNLIRKKIQEEIRKLDINIPTLIHPSVVIGRDVLIKRGTVIMAGAVINSSTTIGEGCIINTSATIDHDNIIKDYVHISPGVNIAGNVVIGNETWIGIGSTINNNINITSKCSIGSGTIVIKDIKDSGTYVGVPARKLV